MRIHIWKHLIFVLLSLGGIGAIGIASIPNSPLSAAAPSIQPASVTASSAEIDSIIASGFTAAQVVPAARSSDSEFLRRVWLDLAGRTPPISAVRKLEGGEPLDRPALVAQLLTSEDYVNYWGRLWADYLTGQRQVESERYNGQKFLHWIAKSFRENTPYDQTVAELVTGEGTSDVSGPVNFLLRYDAQPVPLAGAVSQKMLGLSLQCAECHDHPHAEWKQKDFWGLAAHFARLHKMVPAEGFEGEPFAVVVERSRGELTVPDKKAMKDAEGRFPKKTVAAQLPGEPRTSPQAPRRAALVKWLADAKNPYVSRHFVNQAWTQLLGEPLVPNLDHWQPNGTTVELQVLDRLAGQFAGSGYDIRKLLTTIVLSDTYQRSCVSPVSSASDEDRLAQATLELKHWSRARQRPLSADQIHLSLAQAFGYYFDDDDHRQASAAGMEFLNDIPTDSFGKLPVSLTRSLAMFNGEHARGTVVTAAESAKRAFGSAVGSEQIEWLFQAVLSRQPTDEELAYFEENATSTEAETAIQDIAWVLINSAEFLTNH